MKYINKADMLKNNYTNKELRSMVNKRISELNVRLTDNTDLQAETEYILENTGYINKRNKVSFNTYVSKMNKAQLVQTFNDLTSAIKQDTSSPYYHANVVAKDTLMLKKINKAMALQGEKGINMAQFQEYMKIRDEFSDIFSKDDIYELVKTIKKLRGTKQKPLVDLLRQARADLEDSGEPFSKNDVLRKAQQLSGIWEYQAESVDPKTGERIPKPKDWKR